MSHDSFPKSLFRKRRRLLDTLYMAFGLFYVIFTFKPYLSLQSGSVTIDGWLKLTAPAQTAVLFKELRLTLHSILKDLIRKPEVTCSIPCLIYLAWWSKSSSRLNSLFSCVFRNQVLSTTKSSNLWSIFL